MKLNKMFDFIKNQYINIDMFARHGYEVIHNKNGEHEKNAVGSTLTIIMFLIIGLNFHLEV